ncbi:MAG: DUF2099 family protein [Candidatus Helarchaeota archaeon]|nr:DUF2099 family protein [Candidatus Helarchaeota archaeon]
MPKKIHVWECAKARVEVDETGKVVSVKDPLIQYCPIREYAGWHSEILNKADIIKSMQWKIKTYGLCKNRRILRLKLQGIGYGASECLMTAMDKKIIEAAVVPCEGAGSIISSDKYVIQGIGMVSPALISTFPMPKIIKKLEKLGAHIVDKEEAGTDQVKGVEKSIELGYKKIGVTIAGHELKSVEILRTIEKEKAIQLLIVLIHVTGVTQKDEKFIIKSDISHGCSSKFIRQILEPKNKHVKKFGTILPVYAFSQLGKTVLDLRDKEMLENPPVIYVKKDAIRKPPSPLL